MPACASRPTTSATGSGRSSTPASARSTRPISTVLGYGQFLAQLEAGLAPHHAGMVPPFKEVVEACFVEGLVKVVFATETLAVGINMPARTVVIEKLTKFTGDHHEQLTPGQYTQLTGRAGRRGIDELGHAVVAWSPFVRFEAVAELAASRSFHLRSAFRPTYNMAANLVRNYGDEEAHHLLNLSFAQFQADRDVVRIETRLERQRARLAGLREEAQSPYGDIAEYRQAIEQAREPRGRDDPVELAMLKLRPGNVVYVNKGKYRGPAAVVASAHRKGGLRLTTITAGGDSIQLTAADFGMPPRQLATVTLPTPYAPNRHDYRREVGRRVKNAKLASRGHDDGRAVEVRSAPMFDTRSGMHPVEADPDLRARIRAAGQADRVEREIAELESRVQRHNQSLAREFDGVLGVLSTFGYVDREAWSLTEAGAMLARTFHESDLLVTQCLRLELLDDLTPGRAGRAGLDVRLRTPRARRSAPPVVPVRRRQAQVAQHRRGQRGPGGDRTQLRPRRASPARTDVHRRRLRVDRGRQLRRGGRRRGAHRWRLRQDDEAADRPPRPDRDRRARSRDPPRRAAGRRRRVP